MLSRRGFRYRLYPTPEQAARLRCWEGALRVLWNLATEQRLIYLKRHARMPSAFDQITQLTDLRAEVPWLADVPRNGCAQLLVDPTRYAKSHGVVVVEKLNVAGMVRGGLGRQISGAGWSSFCQMLRYKLEATGGTVVEVPAAYSSQTCPACGLVDAASREGERFRCVGCGHEAHADVNAAIVLLSRRNDGGAGRGGVREVSGPVKRQLRVVRRGHSTQGLGLLQSPGLQAG